METLDTPEVGAWHQEAPWRHRQVALIRVADDQAEQANTMDGKRRLVSDDGGVLLVIWHGKWTTQCRVATPSDREKIRARLA